MPQGLHSVPVTTKQQRDLIGPDHLLIQIDEQLDFAKLVAPLEEQPDEAQAFGPAAPLVTEWRRVRSVGQVAVSRVDRAVAAVRRWELEAEILGEYHLTLPPETDPLDESRREDQVR